jgi:hypothetical protein
MKMLNNKSTNVLFSMQHIYFTHEVFEILHSSLTLLFIIYTYNLLSEDQLFHT